MVSKYCVIDWQQALYDEYMVFRKRSASCAPTTERTIHSAIFGFFTYMNIHNIQSLDAVTATDLKDWHVTSKHSTARVRNLYTSQLRIFFEYLSDRDMVPIDLPLALSCRHASCTTIVKILTEEQLSAIDVYRSNASFPIQLRDTAMIMLGLKMGMRSVDIRKLKLTDISWRKQTISFTQQKTGVYIKLPIATIQESTAKDNGEQSRLEQIQAIISERESKCMEYDDSIVRQMVECIKVYPGGKLEIIFGGRYLVEESV